MRTGIFSVNSLHIFLISFAVIFGSALVGLFLQRFIPNAHITGDSKDAVKLGAGILASMAALVLGLMVSSAKGTFDSVNQQISNASAMDMQLVRVLQQYGPATEPIREELRMSVNNRLQDIWPEEQPVGDAVHGNARGDRTQAHSLESMKKMIMDLQPQTALQRKLQDSALGLVDQIERDRYSIEALSTGNLSMYLIFIPVFWIAALTLIYSTLAARNYTVFCVLLICSLSIAASVFLIFEMSTPLDGRIKVSSAPARRALEMIGH